MSFYGQGYSISRFLIEMGGRPRFLAFRPRRPERRVGHFDSRSLSAHQRPRARPRLEIVAPRRQAEHGPDRLAVRGADRSAIGDGVCAGRLRSIA